jgi:fimbrial chaperone protein
MLRGRFFVFFFLIISFPVYGFHIDFPKDTFEVTGSGRSRSMIVTNVGNNLLAVEVSVVPREIDSEGNDVLGEPSSDFEVYPSQILINPGEDANVSLVWKGVTVPSRELAYRVVSKEIPFHSASEFKSGPVQLLVGRRFLHAAYVTPPRVSANLRLQSLAVSANAELAEMVIVLENSGSAHQIVSGFTIVATHRVDERGNAYPLARPVEIRDPKFSAKVNLLAGGIRRIVIPWPTNLPKQPLKGTLTNVL